MIIQLKHEGKNQKKNGKHFLHVLSHIVHKNILHPITSFIDFFFFLVFVFFSASLSVLLPANFLLIFEAVALFGL